MTNNTDTLNGALRELGETMAANLTTQGVASTWDEGLTTLAGKILDITPGPGPTPSYDGVSLTSDKSILSYADSESATLTAQLLDGSSSASVSGVSVEFFKGSTSLGTATTNSSGVATKSYSSTGAGDVSLTAEVGSLVSETYSLEDCIDYQPLTSNAHQSRWNIPSAVSSSSIFGYSSDGWKFGNVSSYSNIYLNTELTGGISVEFTLVDAKGIQPILVITDSNKTRYVGWNYNTSSKFQITTGANATVVNEVNHALSLNTVYCVEFKDNTVKVYENNILIQSATVTLPNDKLIRFDTGSNRYTQMKELKIKPL